MLQVDAKDRAKARAAGTAAAASNTAGLSDPAAAFALVATQEYVRVYPIGNAVAADRTTVRKIAVQGTLQFASAFTACDTPALACLVDVEGEVHLQVGGGFLEFKVLFAWVSLAAHE